jgi:hypothetical protein
MHRLYIRRRLRTLRGRRASMAAEYDLLHQSHRSVIAAKVSVQNEIDSLLTQPKQLRIDRPKWLDVTLSKRARSCLP